MHRFQYTAMYLSNTSKAPVVNRSIACTRYRLLNTVISYFYIEISIIKDLVEIQVWKRVGTNDLSIINAVKVNSNIRHSHVYDNKSPTKVLFIILNCLLKKNCITNLFEQTGAFSHSKIDVTSSILVFFCLKCLSSIKRWTVAGNHFATFSMSPNV